MTRPVRFARLICAVALVALAATACAGDRPTLEEPGASREVGDGSAATADDAAESITLRLAVGDNWDPDPGAAGPTAVANRVVAALLFEGLTRIDRSGNVQPALAQNWFVSDDRLQWTFVLPDDLRDNDGQLLTARDVKASFERLAARGPADQSVVELSPISGWNGFVSGESGGAAGITAVDARTLVIELDAPFEPLAEVLAGPAFGVVGAGDGEALVPTGAYTFGADRTELVATDPDARVGRIELVAGAEVRGSTIEDGTVDWAVLDRGQTVGAPGSTIRQPLDTTVGIAVRLDDPAQRQAVLATLNPVGLALELPSTVVAVAPAIEPRPAMLPNRLEIVLPDSPLSALALELESSLRSAGIEVETTVLGRQAFAEAVSTGDALVFPMVQTGMGFVGSDVVAMAAPDGLDDLFGADGPARADIVAELYGTVDPVERAALTDALEQQLMAEYLWLPVGTAEVRIGLSDRMVDLRILPDGTLDLSGFGVT